MKHIDERIKEAIATAVSESTAKEAYQRVIFVLEKQLDDYERVWGPRFDPAEFKAAAAARQQLVDDITLVSALLYQYLGKKMPESVLPKRRSGGNGYGER